MIQSHLYARNAETPVYSRPNHDGQPVFILHQGNWMGVLEDNGTWVRVITVNGEGWVQREFTEERLPGDLHILQSPDLTIEYVNSVSSIQ